MNQRKTIVNRMRSLGRGERGRSLRLLELEDDTLYALFVQLRTGSGNRAIARLLQQRGVRGSENSLQQAVSKLRKRLSKLLYADPYDSFPVVPTSLAEIGHLPEQEKLTLLRTIESDYARVVKKMIDTANETGTIPLDLHKHVQGLATITKTVSKLEAQAALNESQWSFDDKEFDARAQFVLENCIGNDGDRLVQMAQKFLVEAEKHCILMDLDQETGEFIESKRHPQCVYE